MKKYILKKKKVAKKPIKKVVKKRMAKVSKSPANTCPNCDGSGLSGSDKCGNCSGKGTV